MSDELIELLVRSLNDEWRVVVQYFIHASHLETLGWPGAASHMQEHAEDEKMHAERLTAHLAGKGVNFTVSVPDVSAGMDPIEMLEKDVDDEIKAIDRYVSALNVIGDDPRLTDTKVLIEDIITDEVEHQDEFIATLKRFLRRGKGNSEASHRISGLFVKAANQSDALYEFDHRLIHRADVLSAWANELMK